MISITSRLLESNHVNSQLIMNANKLIGPNFLDLLKNLRIVLKRERLAYVLVESLLQSLATDAFKSIQRAYQKPLDDIARAGLIIHTSMPPEFQK